MGVIFLISNKAFFYYTASSLLFMSLIALACGLALPDTWMVFGAIAGIIGSIWLFRVAKRTKN